jgi:ATP phosphoribosyltransferase regulatory subunit
MNQLSEQLLCYFAARGCATPEIDLLQPADPLLDTAGEDLRRRIFITTDRNGASLCLRPEFTIPVCLHHLQRGDGHRRYAYAGAVFRQRSEEPVEFRQAGVEDIGDEAKVSADIAAISDCAGAVGAVGLRGFRIVIGDQAVFEAVLASLELPAAWQKRLGRAFGDLDRMRSDVARLSHGNGDALKALSGEVRRLVEIGDRAAVCSWIAERKQQAGLPTSGGRTSSEIAARVLEKAELASARLDRQHRSALNAFLAIECPVAEAPARLERIANAYGLKIRDALQTFSERSVALAKAGLSDGELTYRASFGRRLDYYTGLVFEIVVEGNSKPLAGGGRYDRLMTLLGSPRPVPAVGFSIWLDRLDLAMRPAQ